MNIQYFRDIPVGSKFRFFVDQFANRTPRILVKLENSRFADETGHEKVAAAGAEVLLVELPQVLFSVVYEGRREGETCEPYEVTKRIEAATVREACMIAFDQLSRDGFIAFGPVSVNGITGAELRRQL